MKSESEWGFAFRRAKKTAEGLDLFPPALADHPDELLRYLEGKASRWSVALFVEGLTDEGALLSRIGDGVSRLRGALLRKELSAEDLAGQLRAAEVALAHVLEELEARASERTRAPSA
jgi:hypothetical protein